MVILEYKKSGKVLKLWHVNANSVDVMRLNILSWGLLDPIGTSRVNGFVSAYHRPSQCEVGESRSNPSLVY